MANWKDAKYLSLTLFFFLKIQLSKERLQDKGNNLKQISTD